MESFRKEELRKKGALTPTILRRGDDLIVDDYQKKEIKKAGPNIDPALSPLLLNFDLLLPPSPESCNTHHG